MMRRFSLPITVLCAVVLVVFGSVCGHEFLDYDDAVNIYANAEITNFSPANLLRFWQRPYLNLYIPITYNLWSVLSKVSEFLPAGTPGQPSPALFHGVNLLLHLASALVVFSILKKLFVNPWAACAGALLFALHPVQVEAVSWATGLKDVLSGFWALLAVWQYIAYVKSGTEGGAGCLKRHYLFATLFFLLALLSKPGTVITPLIIGVIGSLLLDRRLGRLILEMLPWLLMTVPIIWVTGSVQGKVHNIIFVPNLWQRLLVGGDTFSFYLAKIFLPLSLGPDYGRTPQLVLGHGWVYLTGLFPYGLALLLLWKARRPWLAAAGVFVSALLPVSGLTPFVFQQISTVADRYLYLAMLGPALATACLLSHYRARLVWMLAVVALCLFGVKSLLQTKHWKTPLAFYAQALRVNPRSWISYNNLGNLKSDMNQMDEAIAAYEKAIAIDPEYADAYNNLGVTRAQNNQPDEAITALSRALEINPLLVDAAINLGDVYKGSGKNAEAIELYQWALNAEPSSIKAYQNLCPLYQELQHKEEAASCYSRLLEISPDSPEIYNTLGMIYKDLNKSAEAVEAYRMALAIRPGSAEVYNNLGFLYAGEKKYSEAIAFYEKAVALLPSHPKPMHNLALTYQAMSRNEEAIAWLQKAIAADGSFAPAFNDLSRIYLEMKQYSLAVEYGKRASELGLMDPEQVRALAPHQKRND